MWQCALGAKAATGFERAIAEVERRRLMSRVNNARFVSLISDGTTDSSATEAEMLYIRYAVRGSVSTELVGIDNVGKADAPTMPHAIDSMVERYLDMPKAMLLKKLVGFGSDGGTAVMTGVNNGVAALLLREQPCFNCF